MGRFATRVGEWRVVAVRSAAVPDAVPLVMIHGLGVSGRYWHPLARLLSRRHQVWVPDLPGHGRSDRPARALDVPALAAVLGEWMKEVGLGPAALIGNSLGCQIAAELAWREPGRAAALVLVGPTVDPAARSAFRQFARLTLSAPAEHPALYPLVLGEYAQAGPRQLLGELRHMLRHRIEDVLPGVKAPTLVLRGRLDRIVPRTWAARVAAMVRDGRLLEIALAGHAAHYTRPRRVAGAVREFLA